MTTYEYLGQMYDIDRKIDRKLNEARKWYDIAYGVGCGEMSEDRVQSSPNLDKMASAVTNAVMYMEEATNIANEMSLLKRKIIRQMERMDRKFYNVLYSRYFEEKTFTDIGYDLHYSARQIKRIYDDAIDDFESRYGEEYLKKRLY